MAIQITSEAFEANHAIPQMHARVGGDASPPLQWRGVPDDARQLALVVDDPDAPGEEPWVHWVIYNIPPDTRRLPPGVSRDEKPPSPRRAAQGLNSWGQIGYGGPQPPRGDPPHHYHFRLYALDVEADLPPGLSKDELMEAAWGHIRDEGELIGTYQ
ncbi:MAG: YbhB/YbcL family Raf kinase inhibitor-like protein [Planctomycetes bacterium]|nr:YbhB/YbcL family Raf kinase inhibitor-like protein [Planctomycetota bacterium]